MNLRASHLTFRCSDEQYSLANDLNFMSFMPEAGPIMSVWASLLISGHSQFSTGLVGKRSYVFAWETWWLTRKLSSECCLFYGHNLASCDRKFHFVKQQTEQRFTQKIAHSKPYHMSSMELVGVLIKVAMLWHSGFQISANVHLTHSKDTNSNIWRHRNNQYGWCKIFSPSTQLYSKCLLQQHFLM